MKISKFLLVLLLLTVLFTSVGWLLPSTVPASIQAWQQNITQIIQPIIQQILPQQDTGGYRPADDWQPADLRQMALQIYHDTYLVRPRLDENFQPVPGQYDVLERSEITSNAEAARVYVQGAALREYQLACVHKGSVYYNRSAGKMVAITFDDGLFATQTPQILEILQQHNARATFFALGRYVQNNPDVARQVLAAGHELGSHAWFHENQTKLNTAQRMENFTRVADAFTEAVGTAPYLFRAPYGAVDDAIKQEINAQNMISVLWSVDTEDWRAKSADEVYNSVAGVVKDGDIILLHENGKHTIKALPRILTYLNEQGYQVVTVSELLYEGSDVQAAAQIN